MSSQFKVRAVMSLMLAFVSATVGANDGAESATAEDKHPFSITLVDDEGKPVEGAMAGVTAGFTGSANKPITSHKIGSLDQDPCLFNFYKQRAGWSYMFGGTSAADGVVHFVDGQQRDRLCVVARHAGRGLVGIAKASKMLPAASEAAASKATEKLVLHRECRVTGRLVCSDLGKEDRMLEPPHVHVWLATSLALECILDDDGAFHLFLPPGEFVIQAYGKNLHFEQKHTVKIMFVKPHVATRTITVIPGRREMDLGVIDLAATRTQLLAGKPAPELSDVVAWKNGPPVKLADLRGKCVILDFWGYWCGPCVSSMPDLFAVYDKYRPQGLEIIGIHVDLGEKEQGSPVDSAEALDAKLAHVRKDIWEGRDVPYPVALFAGKRISDGPRVADQARGWPGVEYGIGRYPTLLLIDKQGYIVGEFDPTQEESIKRLEQLLSKK